MPIPPVNSSEFVSWLSANAIPLLLVTIVALILYRVGRPAIHRVLLRVMHAQQAEASGDAARLEETDRRVTTLEDLFAKILKFAVVMAIVFVILGIFDLWSVLAGLGLLVAALTLAGQDIVLDYLMGILILTEGQYFKGDVVQIGGVEGTVEEVGLRRTIVRDIRGTVHSISNGTIRVSANRTRTYALATVDLDGIAGADIDRVVEAFNAVGAALAQDPAFSDALLEAPAYMATVRLSATGATLRLGGRVKPEFRAAVEAELRLRVWAELAARGIEPIRPAPYGTPEAR